MWPYIVDRGSSRQARMRCLVVQVGRSATQSLNGRSAAIANLCLPLVQLVATKTEIDYKFVRRLAPLFQPKHRFAL